jgi:predicted dehydrogenase
VVTNATSKRWEADHVVVDLTMPCGANVRCLLSYDAPTCERITVVGSDASVQITDPNMALHVRRNDSPASDRMRRVRDFFTLARHALLRHTCMSRFTIERALREFVERLRDGRPFSPGFDDAAFSAALLEAASRSLASGRAQPVVPVPAVSEVHA